VTTRTASEIFLVDSPGWLEYLSEDSKAAAFGHYIENESALVVPSLVVFEVYRQVARLRGKPLADRFLSQALSCRVVAFDEMTAVAAANASLDYRLSMPEAILYSTARSHQAQLVTSNTRFRGLPQTIIL